MELRNYTSEAMLDSGMVCSSQIDREEAMKARTNCVSAVLPIRNFTHGDNAARIDGVIGGIEFSGDTGVVCAGDEGGVIIGHYGGRIPSERVESVVWVGLRATQIEDVTDARFLEAAGGFGHTFEDERVETVVGVFIGARQSFVEEDG